MKNRKGFTLIELLGTFSLIAIILGIVSVSYINITKYIRLSYYNTLEESILVAGEEYYTYTSNRPNLFGEEKKISLSYLVDGKYITNVVDKKGNTCSLNDSYVASYKNSSDKTKYYVCLVCNSDEYKTDTIECGGLADYTLKTSLTINDTSKEYKEDTWVNKYVKVEFKTLNDIKEAVAKDKNGNIKKCSMTLKNGFNSCTLTLDTSGEYELYGINDDKKVNGITKKISVDKTLPTFTIYEDTTKIENKVLKVAESDKISVNINIKDIVDDESKVKNIKYSFGKEEDYITVDNTKEEFSFTKELELGISKLIVIVEDNAGNITKKLIEYEVYNTVEKPTTEFCNNITYNGYEQIITEEAKIGYKFINNKGKNVGEYTVSATLDENYKWEDGTVSDVSFVCNVERNPIAKEAVCNNLTYNGKDQILASNGENITISNNEGKNADSYIVKITANNNYAFSDFSTSKELVCDIAKKELVVTTNSNQSKTYGENDPTLTYTYSGNISGETPKFTGNIKRTIGENVGSYKINQGDLALSDNGTFLTSNYNLIYNNVDFKINKRNITIKANNQTIDYGNSIAMETSNITTSNLINGDTITSITLTQSTVNVTESGIITPSNAVIKNGSNDVSNNYNITYQTGTLIIKDNGICANIYLNGASKVGNNTSDIKLCCTSTNGSSCNIELPSITPKSGFTALGYSDYTNDEDNLTNATYKAGESVTIYKKENDDELTTYYAITKSTTRNTYYITFDLNGATSYTIGGNTYTSTEKFACNADYAYNGDELPDECGITLPTITRDGWTILGWSDDANSKSATYTQEQIINLHDDIDLYAITSKKVTLSYNVNSTTSTTADNLTSKGETKTIYNTNGAVFNIPSFDDGKVCRSNGGDTYHGYKLLGMSTTSDSSNVEYCYGDQIYLENDKTLYLVWQDMYATAVGKVSENLRLREGPGTSYNQLGSIKKGDTIYVKSKNYTWNSSDKHTWYPVIFGYKTGYAAGNTSNNSSLSNFGITSTPYTDSCSYAYSCTSNNKLLSITPSDVVLNITSNTSKQKMQQALTINNQCGTITSATSSNTSLVTATTSGVINAVSGSVSENQTQSATVTFNTLYGCSEKVNVLVKNTEATAPNITISVSGDSSTCSGSYIKGSIATVTCNSDLPITSYSASVGSTSYSPSISGNTYISTINLSSTGTKTINVSCANSEGSSTASKKVSIKVRSKSSACNCDSYSYGSWKEGICFKTEKKTTSQTQWECNYTEEYDVCDMAGAYICKSRTIKCSSYKKCCHT